MFKNIKSLFFYFLKEKNVNSFKNISNFKQKNKSNLFFFKKISFFVKNTNTLFIKKINIFKKKNTNIYVVLFLLTIILVTITQLCLTSH